MLNVDEYFSRTVEYNDLFQVRSISEKKGRYFKQQIIKETLSSRKKKIIGFGDSKADIPFLKECSDGFIYNKRIYRKIK